MKRIPGPGFLGTVKIGPQFVRNYAEAMQSLFQSYGDYAELRGLGPKAFFVFHPDGVEYILKTASKNYVKTSDMDHLKPLLGEGLLTSEGELWREHRRLIAPEFQHKRMEGFFASIRPRLQSTINDWREHKTPFNAAPDISKLTYSIAGDCFFGVELHATAKMVYDTVEVSSAVAIKRMTRVFNLPLWLPLTEHRELRQAIANLNEVVYGIIRERKAHPTERADFLSRMIQLGFKETEIRDEVMTMLLAGHETTSNALAWTIYLLARNPDIQSELQDELDRKVSGSLPDYKELHGLEFTRFVFMEAMRLFPPAAAISRKPVEDDEVGGFAVKKGTDIHLSQWVTHKHPAFWSEPERFNPMRFARPLQHPFSYFPFASGPRECVGKNLAMLEGIVILAGLFKNFCFIGMNEPKTVPRPLITVRPDPGVYIKLASR